MRVSQYIAASQGVGTSFEEIAIRFGAEDEIIDLAVEPDDPDAPPEQRIQMSPAIAASGGKVRVTQSDGSLRTWDVVNQEYID